MLLRCSRRCTRLFRPQLRHRKSLNLPYASRYAGVLFGQRLFSGRSEGEFEESNAIVTADFFDMLAPLETSHNKEQVQLFGSALRNPLAVVEQGSCIFLNPKFRKPEALSEELQDLAHVTDLCIIHEKNKYGNDGVWFETFFDFSTQAGKEAYRNTIERVQAIQLRVPRLKIDYAPDGRTAHARVRMQLMTEEDIQQALEKKALEEESRTLTDIKDLVPYQSALPPAIFMID